MGQVFLPGIRGTGYSFNNMLESQQTSFNPTTLYIHDNLFRLIEIVIYVELD